MDTDRELAIAILGPVVALPAPADMISALADIHAAAFDPPNTWSADSLNSIVAQPTSLLVVAGKPEPVGFALWQVLPPEGELLTIAVAPKYQLLGIGAELLTASESCLAQLRIARLLLEVDEHNSKAISLYNSMQFEQFSVRKDYYGQSNARSDALLLSKFID